MCNMKKSTSRQNILLLKTNAAIRKSRPLLKSEWKYTIREEIVKSPTNHGCMLNLTLIFFRSYGCRFSREGECIMCNYEIAEHMNSESILNIVQEALNEKQHYEALFISPLGSMFDYREVAPEARCHIFELAAATDCISFGTETRPEFLTEEVIIEFAEAFQEKTKQINIGLESSDPWILCNCIGKFLNPADFQASVRLLRQHKVLPIANILLGAPFLTEQESVDSTIRSVRWALNNGAYMCVLFPSNVKRWTLQHWLWERELYQSPSLWSLIEVIYALGPECSRKVALSYYYRGLSNVITEVPHTCQNCQNNVVEILRLYDAKGDFDLIESLRQSKCACRDKWKERISSSPSLSLYDRVVELYRRIAYDLLDPNWWIEKEDVILDQLTEDYDSKKLEKNEIWNLE
jgi:radical SAM enzyme (TIGR01210 family)